MTNYSDPDFPFLATENEDGSFLLEWDENHPVTSIFNTWTEEDFIDAIMASCREILGRQESERNPGE